MPCAEQPKSSLLSTIPPTLHFIGFEFLVTSFGALVSRLTVHEFRRFTLHCSLLTGPVPLTLYASSVLCPLLLTPYSLLSLKRDRHRRGRREPVPSCLTCHKKHKGPAPFRGPALLHNNFFFGEDDLLTRTSVSRSQGRQDLHRAASEKSVPERFRNHPLRFQSDHCLHSPPNLSRRHRHLGR